MSTSSFIMHNRILEVLAPRLGLLTSHADNSSLRFVPHRDVTVPVSLPDADTTRRPDAGRPLQLVLFCWKVNAKWEAVA